MQRRLLVIPISAVLIGGLCIYKQTRTYDRSSISVARTTSKHRAPLFELSNQSKPSELVRLETYIGRHQILVVFFDGKSGAHNDPILKRLRRDFDAVKHANIIVLAISTALPQEHRKAIAEHSSFPFDLLSDPDFPDPGFQVHREWGRFDESTGKPLHGLFLIDQAGYVDWRGHSAIPIDEPDSVIDQLLGN